MLLKENSNKNIKIVKLKDQELVEERYFKNKNSFAQQKTILKAHS
jgi:hypothetical protein